jgi:hypothetical protein
MLKAGQGQDDIPGLKLLLGLRHVCVATQSQQQQHEGDDRKASRTDSYQIEARAGWEKA